MKKICLILFAVYLTELETARIGQKYDPAADAPLVLKIRRGVVKEGDKSLARISWDDNLHMFITFVNDINPRDMKLHVDVYDEFRQIQQRTNIKDACKIDPTTHKGTLAAIFFAAFGIDACPVKAGTYKSKHEFNQTGSIESVFYDLFERYTFIFYATTQDDMRYIKIHYEISVVEAELIDEYGSVEPL